MNIESKDIRLNTEKFKIKELKKQLKELLQVKKDTTEKIRGIRAEIKTAQITIESLKESKK